MYSNPSRFKPTITLSEINYLKDELKRTQTALNESQLSVEKFRNVLRKYLNDRKTFKTQNFDYYRKLSSERDFFKSRFLKAQQEINDLRQEMATMKSDLKMRNFQMNRTIKASAKNTVKLSMMFLKMKATKQTIETKRSEFETMCNELILYMKEQSDLMKFVTENMLQECENADSSIQILEFLKRFSWLLFENSKLRYQLITHQYTNMPGRCDKTKCLDEDKSIILKNLEEASQILEKISNFQRYSYKPCYGSISLDGSETTIFEREEQLYAAHQVYRLKRTRSASSIGPF